MKKLFSLLLTIIMWQIIYGQSGVGIGTTDPHAPLQFANQLADRKIVLFENADNNHEFFGLGVNYGALNYQVANVNNDHVFQSAYDSTSNNELMRITGWGLIGMGTPFPHNRLDIHYGSPRTGDHAWYRPLYVTGDIDEGNGIEFRHSNGTQGIGFGYNTIYATGSNDNQVLKFASRGYAPLIFKTNDFERMVISEDGNVGIGTSYPTAQLHLANSVQNRKIVLYDNSGNDYEFFGLGVSGDGTFRYHVSNTINDHAFFAGSSDSTASELMRIKGTGQVGIGVNAPQNRLDLHYDSNLRSGTHSTGNALYVTGDFSTGHGVQFRQTDGTQGIGFGGHTIYANGSNSDQELVLAAKGSNGILQFATNGYERVRITGSGNVGINIGNPHAPLQFANIAANRKIVLFENADNDHQFFGMGINGDGSMRFQTPDIGNDYVFYSAIDATSSNEIFRIKGNGLMGMGVAAPLNKLDINYGPARTGTHPNGLAGYITADLLPAGNGVEIRHYNSTQGIGFGSNTIYATGSDANQPLKFASRGYAPLVFKTNTVERMIISEDGNVGINVTAPQNQLDLHHNGVARSGTHATNQTLYVTGDFANNYGVQFRQTDGTEGIGFGSHTIYAAGSNPDQELILGSKGPNSFLKFTINGYERMRITGSGVGINYSTPHAPLQFAPIAENRKIVLFEGANNNHQFIGFGVNGDGAMRFQTAGPTNDYVFYSAINDTSSNEIFRIKGSGQVGMGVAAPLNKLDIAAGPARTGTHPNNLATYITGDFGDNENVEFRSYDGKHGIGIGYETIYAASSDASQNLSIGAKGTTGQLSFITNSIERLKINGAGNFGFGVGAPLNKLDIHNGTARSNLHGSGQALYVTGGGEFRSADATTGLGIGSNNIFATGSIPSVDLSLAAKGASGNILFNANGAEKVRITAAGRVGIGTTSPNAPIQINGGTPNRSIVLFETVNNEHQFYGFGINGNTLRYQTDNMLSDHVFFSAIDGNTSKELMRIKGNGNVGIGITAPLNKLDIAGAARSNTHNSGQALYVTGGGEFRSADATTGLVIGSNNIAASGSNANVDLSLAAKGSTGNVVLNTNALDRMVVTGSGNVGMGIATPLNKLDISYGPTRTGTQPTGLAAYITSDLGANQNVEIRNYDGSQGVGIGLGSIYAAGSALSHNLSISAKGLTGTLSFVTNSAERMKITANGFIGVGVSNPINGIDIHNGPARSNVHGGGQGLYVTGGGEFRSADATTGLVIGSNNITASGSNPFVDLSLAAKGASGNIIFNANGGEKVRITAAGDVGVGIAAPANKMDIAGAARTNTHPSGRPLYVTGNISPNSGGVEIRNNDGTQGIGLGTTTIYAAGSNVDQNIGMEAKGGGNVRFTANGLERVRITSLGKVGIGTTVPNGELQLGPSLVNRKIVMWELDNNDHQFFGFGVNDNGTLRYQTAASTNDHVFYSGASSSSSTEIMRLTGTGNLTTLGSITAGGDIAVNGTITTEAFTIADLTATGNFTNYGAGYATAAFYKDKIGIVHLRGLVLRNASQNGLVIFTLPAGYRPSTSGTLLFTTQANSGMSRIDILADGSVKVMAGSTGWIGLDGISFRAD